MQLQSFIGLVNYYSRMIKGYAGIAAPLTAIMAKPWNAATKSQHWTPECTTAFEILREKLKTEPVVLLIPQDNLPWVVQADASNHALGGCLMQVHPDGTRSVVLYFSHKWSQTEKNWPVHERELFALVYALRKFRHYLMGEEFTYEGDHKPLAWIRTQTTLSGKQARWLETLESFNWTFKYVPGKQLVVPDAISRADLDFMPYLLLAAGPECIECRAQPHLSETLCRIASGVDKASAPLDVDADFLSLLSDLDVHQLHALGEGQDFSSSDVVEGPRRAVISNDTSTTAVGDLFLAAEWMHKLRVVLQDDSFSLRILNGEEVNGFTAAEGLCSAPTIARIGTLSQCCTCHPALTN